MDHILLRINKIVKETAAAKTFFLSPVSGQFQYTAGQFITLLLEIAGREVRRSYSFGSTPHVDDEIFITLKRLENGEVSRYLFDNVKEGTLLKALPAAGRFTLTKEASLYFFIAAGSGITPIFSLLKDVLKRKEKSKVILLYQNTNEALSIYRKQLLFLQSQNSNRFKLTEFFSQPFHDNFRPVRLNNYALENLVLQQVDTNSVMFYLCGPVSFMRMAEFTLRIMGYQESFIRKENFVVDHIPKPPIINDPSPKNVTIVYDGHQYDVEVAYPQNILQAALLQNLQLPYSCRGGRCSVCAAICISGKVKMSLNEVLTEKDLSKGMVLTCVGYAETDIVLDFDKNTSSE